MPASLIHDENSMRVLGDMVRNFGQMLVHGMGVAPRHDECGSLAKLRADRSEDIGWRFWCTEVDSVSHLHGLQSSQRLKKMRACDDVVGELRAWRDAQPERDGITLFIVSDHGHVTIGGTVNVADAPCQAGFKAAASQPAFLADTPSETVHLSTICSCASR